MKLVDKEQDNWDEFLDGVLFAYRTSVQKSTQFTPFELMYCRYVLHTICCALYYSESLMLWSQLIVIHLPCIGRKPVLPIERELLNESTPEGDDNWEDDVDEYCEELVKLRKDLYGRAYKNIKIAQGRQKRDYDNKHHRKKV